MIVAIFIGMISYNLFIGRVFDWDYDEAASIAIIGAIFFPIYIPIMIIIILIKKSFKDTITINKKIEDFIG